MTLLDWLIGTGAALAAGAAFALYLASIVLRERRGPDARTATLATSRPLFTAAFAGIVVAGGVLLVLRLGVLS